MEIQPAGSQLVLKVAMKGAAQGLKYIEHGVKFLEENFLVNLCRSPFFQTFQHTIFVLHIISATKNCFKARSS